MNTRNAIQPSNQPAVLSVAFSATRNRFITGLSDGFRCFRTDNCFTTYQPTLPSEGGIAIAAALDDRYQAYVGGGRAPAGKDGAVIFWDALLGKALNRFDFHEAVLGVRLSGRYMVVLLKERAIGFEHQELERPSLPTPPPDAADDDGSPETDAEVLRGPNLVKALYPTSPNTYALGSLKGDLLVLPAQTPGQVQLIPLHAGSKRVLRAHNSPLRCLALSDDGTLLATASEQGTLLRIFNTRTTDELAEFRRGVDHAIIYSLAFSPGNRWLACTSDKGTLHIFDLRPPDPATIAAEQDRLAKERQQQHRRSQSYATHRLSGGTAYENASSLSGGGGGGGNVSLGRSSPASATGTGAGTGYQGSVQEYYGLRPVPTSASPPTAGVGISAMAAFKASPWAPKVLKDVRSIASAPFYTGEDGPYWQGGAGHSWTTTPSGGRKRVRNAAATLPNDPSGRPPKGVLAFKPTGNAKDDDGGDDDGAVVYVVGGGRDARWEQFALLPTEGRGWVLVNEGFRKYLTRQFVD
ncbi:hypothetical protein LTR36_006715 [Oleoguttula mirabilis]|uniref:WD40 repeat-like protein n=1 Tax=Oleoguttula mirabilis TaxID=1507867 RepID=A0AAV9JBL1_9PEZI|nr:hypothetical protein LTR36_006715 [Oleoguttula mirabilis]